ncbi:hypothetical protein O988_03969 [Pseudogymnoascus sp. VKM F-3808]|nr:hypothetical protein O988_03969 [Pseudogymnoascus sp. VKM F-3808]
MSLYYRRLSNHPQAASRNTTTPRHQPRRGSHRHDPQAATRHQPQQSVTARALTSTLAFECCQITTTLKTPTPTPNPAAAMPKKLSPADKAAIKKRQQQIKDAHHLQATVSFSDAVQMTQEELKKFMLNLGDPSLTDEPGNTLRKEVMNIYDGKFRAFCRYAHVWDTVGRQYEAVDAAIALLRNHNNATLEQFKEAQDVLQHYLDTSDQIFGYGYRLLCMVNDSEALVLRQLVSAQTDATINRQDLVFLVLESSHVSLSFKKIRHALAMPFKLCGAGVDRICHKIKKAKKKRARKSRDTIGRITV